MSFPSEIRFSGWERKQPGGMYCVRTVGAASALRARFLRSYVPLRRDRVKTCALTIHTSRRTLSQSDKSRIFLNHLYRLFPRQMFYLHLHHTQRFPLPFDGFIPVFGSVIRRYFTASFSIAERFSVSSSRIRILPKAMMLRK